ncbi:hypothetical protein B5X24_HaOG212304 [Helicoverpa armigera]|uniref:Uncharacterized protein n=1 Tax=Helicoverpa armigera TaxID=29058 RepID=A0A2W1B0B8_HELAM|nr:hypothetical protein B5X24_HaOG215443 [Helicoverpa armigera]PZC71857.1 hypothetical protein B5X24_HaOG212304 [Helicoverpa armigera]
MIRTIALLCLVAAPAFGAFTANMRVRFDLNPFGFGSSSFVEMPLTIWEAVAKNWVQKTGPTLPSGYENLVLYGPADDNTLNLYYDDNYQIAAFQIGLDKEQISDSVYDFENQGFTSWTTTLSNGTSRDYWTIRAYFSTADYLATDATARNSSRNTETLIQGGSMVVTGFNGELYTISSDPTVLADTSVSGFTEQACMVYMGHHFYYNMTTSLECAEGRLFPWFPLSYNGVVMGIGFNFIGKYDVRPDNFNYFESPGVAAVKIIVPKGPQCFYELAENPGVVTMHVYFIETPRQALCVFEG